MNKRNLLIGVKFFISFLATAFAAQIAVVLADPGYAEHINQVAPVFGVALAVILVGGFRYLPSVFVGALIPSAFAESDFLIILSTPVAATASASLGVLILRRLQAHSEMERIRDALYIIFFGVVLGTSVGAFLQTLFLCSGNADIPWSNFKGLFFASWLSATVGAIIVTPFILVWSHPGGYRLSTRQLFEVFLWFVTLIVFGLVTFRNWAPTDVLFYPMELAIFPIMAWAAIRFGLRGASAGVVALALLAAWVLVPELSGESLRISQSPANVWVFVGIVSVTSISLAAVMTELRLREAEIAENESRLRAFTDALPDIAFVLSRDGLVHDVFAVNSQVEANHRIFNSKRVRGKYLSEIFAPEIAEHFQETVRATLDSNTVTTFEYALQSADVGEHHFEARVSPMTASDESPDRVVWVAYDITAHKESEGAILQRDRILKATALANNTLLTTADFDKAVESAIRDLSKALRVDRGYIFEIRGLEEESFHHLNCRYEWRLNDNCPSLLENLSLKNAPLEEFFPQFQERLSQDGVIKINSDTSVAAETEALRSQQSRALLAIPLWLDSQLYGFFGVDYCNRSHIWNDSEVSAVRVLASGLSGLFLKRQREEELQAARDMADAASAAKGEFMAMMSHEIRTPMNAIIGYSDLFSQTQLSEQQSEYASTIKRSGRSLLELINNILDYSKIESRTLELESTDLDIEQIVCESLQNILPMAREKGLKIDYQIDDAVSEIYVGDPHRLRQVLINLANNAVKFTRKGSILMRVGVADETVAPSNGYDALHFEVIDTGCGIADDKFERVFMAFSQVDSSTTRKFGGTGLGLAISQRLIERMNGRIWIESKVGEGSNFQFVVHLPRPEQIDRSRPPFAENRDSEESIGPDFAKSYPLKLLICEDDHDNRWVIRELLETLGYEVKVVEDPDDAIVQLENYHFDAVLLDVRLPGISGIKLSQMIRSGQIGENCRDRYIIAVTAFAMNQDRDNCLAAGMNDYLSKPLEISRLKETLRIAHRAVTLV
jgi:PAS domain S-box-containing protein